MSDSVIELPPTDSNTGPYKHTVTRTNADLQETHEDVVQVVSLDEANELLRSISQTLEQIRDKENFQCIGDGNNNIASVLMAGTAAGKTDRPLVVAFHPATPVVFPQSRAKIIGTSGNISVTTATVWDEWAVWPIPNNSIFKPKLVRAAVTTAGSRTLIGIGKKLATFEPNGNLFNSLATLSGTDFYDRLFYRTALTHSATATTVTATYINQAGTAGQATSGNVIAASSPAGNWYEFTLAANDFGVQAITAVSDTAAPTAVVDEIWGIRTLHDTLGAANAFEVGQLGEGLGHDSSESVVVLLMAAATTAQQRLAHILGDLIAA